ncbi:MAG: bifunctional ornithine acetyltransferase/N-acetylglutamate synthase, partial [Eggerthellaceae bacterium]|nr:bifunctional ornithine acetyltransferase/N-acetylglutamate synthase [Eggerthellaceae bacterium]
SALSDCGSNEAASAIMTTDTKAKEVAVSFVIDGIECRIGGIAKGSGMIHPNMATMLAFITSDANITPSALSLALKAVVEDTFNMISIDGDTSTNDMAVVLANGCAHNNAIEENKESFDLFKSALETVCKVLSRMMAADGEGASKLITCNVSGGHDVAAAKCIAKSVIASSLVKAAMFGSDANWGRVLCAIGYSGIEVDVMKIGVWFASKAGRIEVCRNGVGVEFSEERAKEILLCDEVDIDIDLASGDAKATAWGCDLTYEYVRINGDYRS